MSARPLHLNKIENLWGCHARKVCKKRRQFSTAAEFKQAITEERKIIAQKYRKNVFDSLLDIIFEDINVNGKCSHFLFFQLKAN